MQVPITRIQKKRTKELDMKNVKDKDRKPSRTLYGLSCLALSGLSFAAEPIVEITEPTAENIVYSASFPFVQPISFTLEATTKKQGQDQVSAELQDLNGLDVKVDDETIINGGDPIGNPFTNANACAGSLLDSATCTVLDAKNAEVTVPWTVDEPGQYTITVSVRIQSDTGQDEEVVMVEMLNAEYPAPPAVANAFIKANPAVLTHKKQHGCVISRIANEHAKYPTFGPKGGPYDTAKIHEYVEHFAASCI
jgi:hypothetical protein